MKKLIAMLMALCLMGTCALAEMTQFNWTDVEKVLEEKGLKGEFYTLNAVNVKFWVPEDLKPVEELPDEVKNMDVIAMFLNDSADKGITVVYTDINGATLEQYADALPEYGVEHIAIEVVNGLTAVEYSNSEKGTETVGFLSDTGKLLEITMSPVDMENPELEWAMVIASIQPA